MPPSQIPASPKASRPVIVLTGGGSGGHITPLLSLAHELKKQNNKCKIIYIGLKGEKVEGLQERYRIFDQVYDVPAGKFRRYHGQSVLARITDVKTLALNSRDFFRFSRGILVSRKLLKRLKPDVVFSKGGFVAVPVGMAAARQKIPIITHDSDAIPGLANRIISRWAVIHAVGQPIENYAYPKDSTYYVGVPVAPQVQPVSKADQAAFKKQLGVPTDSVLLLVGGAGLGARDLNQAVVRLAAGLFKAVPGLHIAHLTGTQHESEVSKGYSDVLGKSDLLKVSVLGFTSDFYKYTGAADVVLTRAGATTLAELALQRKPAVLVPAEFLTGGHQLKNAQRLKNAGAAELVTGDNSDQELLKTLTSLLNNPNKRLQLAEKLGQTARPAAAKELAGLILQVANKKFNKQNAPA